jgi:hypothetical protein
LVVQVAVRRMPPVLEVVVALKGLGILTVVLAVVTVK